MRHHIIPILCAIHHIILLFCSCSRSGDGDLLARNLAMAIFLLAICSCSRLFFFLLVNLAVGRLGHLGNISSYEFLLGPDCYSGVRSDDWSRNKNFSRYVEFCNPNHCITWSNNHLTGEIASSLYWRHGCTFASHCFSVKKKGNALQNPSVMAAVRRGTYDSASVGIMTVQIGPASVL